MDTVVSTADVARLTGVGGRVLRKWLRTNVVKSGRKIKGPGKNHHFTTLDILAVSLARDLQARGVHLTAVGNVVRWLQSKTLADVLADFSRGRVLLMVIGDCPPFPRLLHHDEVFANDAVDLRGAFEANVPVAVVNLEKAYHAVLEKLREEAL